MVDADAICTWGISLSAGIALASAAVDHRIAAVIAIAPIFKFLPVKASDAHRLKTKLMKDRESQVVYGNPPYILPLMESLAEIPFNSHVNAGAYEGRNSDKKKAEEEDMRLLKEWQLDAAPGDTYDPTVTHNPYGTTIQSYHRMFMFEPVPLGLIKDVSPTPAFFLTPELDQISLPAHQSEAFQMLDGPKRQMIAPGKEHVYVLNGTDMPEFVKWQIDFIWQVVRGRFKTATTAKPPEKAGFAITQNAVDLPAMSAN